MAPCDESCQCEDAHRWCQEHQKTQEKVASHDMLVEHIKDYLAELKGLRMESRMVEMENIVAGMSKTLGHLEQMGLETQNLHKTNSDKIQSVLWVNGARKWIITVGVSVLLAVGIPVVGMFTTLRSDIILIRHEMTGFASQAKDLRAEQIRIEKTTNETVSKLIYLLEQHGSYMQQVRKK